MTNHILNIIAGLIFLSILSCNRNYKPKENEKNIQMKEVANNSQKSEPLIIAHRGTTFWAPEETEAAMRWARNTGAHYLELDLQRTKDGYLIALHDNNLKRTTNIAEIFPDRKDQPVSSFTYKELLSLDAGSWFNKANPHRARTSFGKQDILTLEDVIQIAEGKRIKRTQNSQRILHTDLSGRVYTEYEIDPADNGNRPGIYIETKIPMLFPGIEKDLEQELIKYGWYAPDQNKLKLIQVNPGKITVANSNQRVILQTFSRESLKKLNSIFSDYVPITFLLWRGTEIDDIPDESLKSYEDWVKYGKENGATIIGPSITGAPNHYEDLLKPEHASLIKKHNMLIHAYSFDTPEQMETYSERADGMFTNKTDMTIQFYGTKNQNTATAKPDAITILKELGY